MAICCMTGPTEAIATVGETSCQDGTMRRLLRRRRLDDLADDAGVVAEAMHRLQSADLMPPVNRLQSVGYVLVTTSDELTPELRARISSALDGLPHKIEQVPPDRGVLYAGPH
jgi:hypothetical protein